MQIDNVIPIIHSEFWTKTSEQHSNRKKRKKNYSHSANYETDLSILTSTQVLHELIRFGEEITFPVASKISGTTVYSRLTNLNMASSGKCFFANSLCRKASEFYIVVQFQFRPFSYGVKSHRIRSQKRYVMNLYIYQMWFWFSDLKKNCQNITHCIRTLTMALSRLLVLPAHS